jgi:hypothetical protein
MITSTSGVWWEMPVTGQPPGIFCNQILAALETMGIFPDIDPSSLESTDTPYDLSAVHAFGQALSRVNTVFSRFRNELPGDRSEVDLWPHHFDLSLMWLSGRKVAGVDPNDEEYADEQMTFGFSTGDEGIPDAYFYATAYPWPPAIVNKSLPPGTTWHTQGWKGGLMMYKSLTEAHNPEEKLLHFLRAAYLAGSTLMI